MPRKAIKKSGAPRGRADMTTEERNADLAVRFAVAQDAFESVSYDPVVSSIDRARGFELEADAALLQRTALLKEAAKLRDQDEPNIARAVELEEQAASAFNVFITLSEKADKIHARLTKLAYAEQRPLEPADPAQGGSGTVINLVMDGARADTHSA